MKLTTTGAQYVDEGIEYGLYLALYNGKYVIDENHNWLCIKSKRFDLVKINELIRTAVEDCGLDRQKVSYEWYPGGRAISESEYEEQIDRMKEGRVPDPEDAGVTIDEYRHGTN